VLELERLQAQYAAQLQDSLAGSAEARAQLDQYASASRDSLGLASEILQDEVIMADASIALGAVLRPDRRRDGEDLPVQ